MSVYADPFAPGGYPAGGGFAYPDDLLADLYAQRIGAAPVSDLVSIDAATNIMGRERGPVEWLGDTLGIVGSAVARGVDLGWDVLEGDFSWGEVGDHLSGFGRSVAGIFGAGGNPDEWQYYFGDVLAERGSGGRLV